MKGREFISLGRITKPQGLKGAFRVRAHGVESENLLNVDTIYIRSSSGLPESYAVQSIQQRKGFFVVRVREIDRIEKVTPLIQSEILAAKDDIPPLEEGEYYWYELVGLKVETKSGRNLGTVQSIIPTGSNDVLQVRKQKQEFLIPLIEEVIIKVDLESGMILIDPIPGLLD